MKLTSVIGNHLIRLAFGLELPLAPAHVRDLLLALDAKPAAKTHRLTAIDLYGAFLVSVGLYRWFAVVSPAIGLMRLSALPPSHPPQGPEDLADNVGVLGEGCVGFVREVGGDQPEPGRLGSWARP